MVDNKDELKRMEEDVKKAVGKEKEDLVAKTIAETKEKLAKEQETAELKEKLAELEKAKEEDAKKREEDLEKMRQEFKEAQEKLVKDFQDSRQSTVKTNNPFAGNSSTDENKSPVELFKSNEEFRENVNKASEEKAYEYWTSRQKR